MMGFPLNFINSFGETWEYYFLDHLIMGRFIGEITPVIYDVIHSTFEKHIPGILLLIDFEKGI